MKNFFANIWVHIVFVFVLGFFVFGRLHGFCMAIPSAIWGSFSIASEYILNQYGNTINGSEFVASDINNPFTSSSSFGSAYANSLGANLSFEATSQEGFDWLDGYGKVDDVDLSKYPTADAAQFLLKLVPDGVDYTPERYQIKKFKAGVISVFYLLDKQTQQLVADSYKNICIKIDSLSASDIESIKSALPSSHDILISDDFSVSCYAVYDNSSHNLIVNSDYDVLFYSLKDSVFHIVSDRNLDFSYNGDIHISYYRLSDGYNPTLNYPSNLRSSTFEINGTTYFDFSFSVLGDGTRLAPYENFSSFQDVLNYIQTYGFRTVGFSSELIDTKSLPYTVPSLRDTIVGIDDIYPALQAIREGILTIPTTGELATTLTDTLKGSIADTIADAIAKGISEVKEGDIHPDSKPDFPDFPDELPPSYFPSFITDLFPTDMFSIFKPVFDIVGVDFSMFDTWMLIPAIFIALFIFYIIISVL